MDGGYGNPWEMLEEDGEGERKGWRARNFAEFMHYLKDIFRFEEFLRDMFDWASLGPAILGRLVPALRPGNRVIIVEYIEGLEQKKKGEGVAAAPDGDLPRAVRQMGSATDVRIMALFNCRERPVGEWGRLLRAADERFEVVSVKAGPHDFFAVVEAVWRG